MLPCASENLEEFKRDDMRRRVIERDNETDETRENGVNCVRGEENDGEKLGVQ